MRLSIEKKDFKKIRLIYRLVFILLLVSIRSSAEVPVTKWVLNAGGTLEDQSQSVASDKNGNIYVAGFFSSSTIKFGSNTLYNSNPGNKHPFLVKYDSIGNVLWAKSSGNFDIGYGLSVNVDYQGNVLMSGSFSSSSITFGNYTLYDNTMYGFVFLVKYDSLGNVLWARTADTDYSNAMISICSDPTGAIYATGHFQGSSISFGSKTITNTSYPNQDVFLVKFDAQGNTLWAKNFGGSEHDVGNSVIVDKDNSVIISGYYLSPTIKFGTISLANKGNGTTDGFLSKLDSDGNVLWAKSIGGTATDYNTSATCDRFGNIFVGGYFKSNTINFGNSITLTNPNPGYVKFFLSKYDSSGNAIWAKQSTNSLTNDAINSVCTDNLGNVYATGYFESSSIMLDTVKLVNSGSGTQDIFIAKYNNSGNILWAKGSGGSGNDFGKSICANSVGDAYVTGEFASPGISFDAINLTNTSAGTSDVFLAKMFSTSITSDSTTLYYCGSDSIITLAAFDGYESYKWYDSNNDLIGTSKLVGVKVLTDSAVFTCKMSMASGTLLNYKITILKNKPVANFSFQNNCFSNTVRFTNLSTTNRGKLTYKWDFGDGNYSTLENPQYTFSTSGRHQVTLEITETNSLCTANVDKSVETFLPSQIGIDGNSTFCPGYTTTLKAYGANHYKWSNGSVSESIEVGTPGKIWMLAYSETNCVSDTVFKTIDVEPDFPLSIEGGTYLCEGDSIVLQAVGATSYVWNTGETTTSITVSAPGHYTVTGRNSLGCEKSTTTVVVSDVLPQVNFHLSATEVDSKNNEIVATVPKMDGVQYAWDMGDGQTELGSNIHHDYNPINGIYEYNITLKAITPNGCEYRKSKTIDVVPFIPNVFTPNGDGANDMFMVGYDLKILDRNGKTLFDGKTGWDGTYKGIELDTDTYFYLITFKDKNQQLHSKKGFVTLIR